MTGYQQHPYALLLLTTALVTGAVGVLALARRSSPGMRSLSGLCCVLSFWSLSYALAWASIDEQPRRDWFYLMYLAVLALPPIFLILVLQITRQADWLTPLRLTILSIEPALMFLAVWTNDLHHRFIPSFDSFTRDGFLFFTIQRGPYYWANLLYSYGILLAGMWLLVRAYTHTSLIFRRQLAALMLGAAMPWVANLVTVLGIVRLAGLDLTPVAFSLTAVTFYFALPGESRIDLLPLARSLLLHATSDGLLVLDADFRIVDVNEAAAETIGLPARQIIGMNGLDLFPEWQDMLALLRANRHDIHTETQGRADMARYYDVKANPITREEAITGYLVLFRDITDRWRAEQELRQANYELKTRLQEIEILQRELRLQATRDPLTNLYNRRYLEEILEKELARAERKSSPVSVIMMDADKFKRVNDLFGHKAGDRALQALAVIILKNIRSSDIACRYGGEEFVIVMPNTEPEVARERAEHIRHDFYQVEFQGAESVGQTSLSIGIATYPRAGLRADAILDAADQAMYAAKRSGGNRINLHGGQTKSDTLRLDPPQDASSAPPRRPKGK